MRVVFKGLFTRKTIRHHVSGVLMIVGLGIALGSYIARAIVYEPIISDFSLREVLLLIILGGSFLGIVLSLYLLKRLGKPFEYKGKNTILERLFGLCGTLFTLVFAFYLSFIIAGLPVITIFITVPLGVIFVGWGLIMWFQEYKCSKKALR